MSWRRAAADLVAILVGVIGASEPQPRRQARRRCRSRTTNSARAGSQTPLALKLFANNVAGAKPATPIVPSKTSPTSQVIRRRSARARCRAGCDVRDYAARRSFDVHSLAGAF